MSKKYGNAEFLGIKKVKKKKGTPCATPLRKNQKSDKKFNFCGRCLHLTYKTHITLEQIRAVFDKMSKKYKVNAVHESSDKEDAYDHTHVHIYFCKKIHIRDPRKFDISDIHPNVKFIGTREHHLNLIGYLQKQNKPFVQELTGNEFAWNGTVRDKIQACNKWTQVINHKDEDVIRTTMCYLSWAKEVFNCRPQMNRTKNLKFRKWQTEVLKMIEKQNDQEILWIYDEEGGNGKTVLSNYLIDNKDALLVNCGKVADVAYAYNQEKIIIFDLPRTTIDSNGKDWTPYRMMEMFKDGRIFSPKYQSCMKKFEPCKVIVMANYKPDLSSMSKRRWNILSLDHGILTKLVQPTENDESSEELNISEPRATPALPMGRSPSPPLVPRPLNIKAGSRIRKRIKGKPNIKKISIEELKRRKKNAQLLL